jgi:hypothetical protein
VNMTISLMEVGISVVIVQWRYADEVKNPFEVEEVVDGSDVGRSLELQRGWVIYLCNPYVSHMITCLPL